MTDAFEKLRQFSNKLKQSTAAIALRIEKKLQPFLLLFLFLREIVFLAGILVFTWIIGTYYKLSAADLLVVLATFFSGPIVILIARNLLSLKRLSPRQATSVHAGERLVSSLLLYALPLVALLSGVTLGLANRNITNVLLSSSWIAGLVVAIELVKVRVLLALIRSHTSHVVGIVAFFVLSYVVNVPFAVGSAYVVHDVLALPAWIDLPIVSYIPLLVWFPTLGYLHMVSNLAVALRYEPKKLDDAIDQYKEALERVRFGTLEKMRLQARLAGSTDLSTPILHQGSFWIVGFMTDGTYVVLLGDTEQVTQPNVRLQKMIRFLLSSSPKAPGASHRVKAWLYRFVIFPRVASESDKAEALILRKSPRQYRTDEAYKVDRALYLSDREMQTMAIEKLDRVEFAAITESTFRNIS